MNSTLSLVFYGQKDFRANAIHSEMCPATIISYHLLGPMNKMLGGQKFASDTELQSTDPQWLRQQPASFLHKAFRNLLRGGKWE